MTNIHPTAIVGGGARLGADVEVGPYCIVGGEVELGARVRLISHAIVQGRTSIGEDCTVYPFAVLGTPPQHTAHRGEPTRLELGARNLVREHVTMHAGTAFGRGVTTVGSDCLFYVGAHVAHDCVLGDHVILINSATLGGHVVVEDYVIMGGLAAAHQNTRLGRHAFIGGMAGINYDVIPYGNVWGNHAHLEGLNLIGLKRRGFSRETINTLRAAYRMLFAEEGAFQERLDDTAAAYARSPEVMEIVEFIRAASDRPITMPRRDE
ncbi:MAG TPA: acyl-ACP--UDP-N-acetylglucosamine O-acyltransferase [Caulobacteraceae bacterium]|nr:acyl-ACP--UDP-N-acetylglucosamine O-acyltransferase [Caulobacteraceae bacterium]